jgi:hypothetical protein
MFRFCSFSENDFQESISLAGRRNVISAKQLAYMPTTRGDRCAPSDDLRRDTASVAQS